MPSLQVDAERRVLSWSAQAVKLFGISSNHALGERLEALELAPDALSGDGALLCSLFKTSDRSTSTQHMEIPLASRKGERFPGELAVSPLHTRSGVELLQSLLAAPDVQEHPARPRIALQQPGELLVGHLVVQPDDAGDERAEVLVDHVGRADLRGRFCRREADGDGGA